MNHPKYSVIIPVYNAEHTLERCVSNLTSQNYTNAEIILVNDGSRDSSHNLCLSLAEHYPQIKYLCKENGGVSSARNAGLDIAEGEYILFVDSDDYVSDNYFAVIDRTLNAQQYDWVFFSYWITNGRNIKKREFFPFHSSDPATYISKVSDAICKKTINPPWSKVYRRDIIQNHTLRFPEDLSIGEDKVFNIAYSMYIRNLCFLSEGLYYLSTQNDQSLSRKFRSDSDREQQFSLINHYLDSLLTTPSLAPEVRQMYSAAFNFSTYRGVYSNAKRMQQMKVSWGMRLRQLNAECDEIRTEQLPYPNTAFCRMIALPVRLKLTPLIDLLIKLRMMR